MASLVLFCFLSFLLGFHLHQCILIIFGLVRKDFLYTCVIYHRGPNPGKSMWSFVILPPGSARHLSLPWLDHPLKLVCDVPHWNVLCIHSIFGNRRMPWVFCWLFSSKLYILAPTPQPYHHHPPPNPHPATLPPPPTPKPPPRNPTTTTHPQTPTTTTTTPSSAWSMGISLSTT